MGKNFNKPKTDELKELFDNQCSPCISGYPECGGNQAKAENWTCPKFYSGFMTMTVEVDKLSCIINPSSCERVQLAHEALERTTFYFKNEDESWNKAVYATCQSCDRKVGNKTEAEE